MRPFDNSLHPDQRFREIAGIFAAGILRLHARAALLVPAPENLLESGQDCLDSPAETVLSGHTG